jgi:hypothetical protein
VPERYTEHVREMIEEDDDVAAVTELQVVYLGPREVLVTGSVRLRDGLDAGAVADTLARVRDEVGGHYPQVGRWYLTPVR